MKSAITRNAADFNSHRMMRRYATESRCGSGRLAHTGSETGPMALVKTCRERRSREPVVGVDVGGRMMRGGPLRLTATVDRGCADKLPPDQKAVYTLATRAASEPIRPVKTLRGEC